MVTQTRTGVIAAASTTANAPAAAPTAAPTAAPAAPPAAGGGGGGGGGGGPPGGGGGGGGGGGPPPANPVQNPPPVPPQRILLTPWDGEIDLTTRHGQRMWEEGIEAMDRKFTGTAKDLPRFMGDLKVRVLKCRYNYIVRFGNLSLLSDHGQIPLTTVRDARDAYKAKGAPATLAEAQEGIHRLMMFHFLYDSLENYPLKKIQNQLDDINEDGPMLLKVILKSTFTATNATTFSIKEKLFNLDMKRYKHNVQALNQDVREKMVDLVAAGHRADDTELVINLFRAYNTSTNEDFKTAVAFWRNQWETNEFTDPEVLMEKADEKYTSLRDFGSWGKKSAKDEQIVALTSQIKSLKDGASSKQKKGTGGGNKGSSDTEHKLSWKKDRSLSTTQELERNDKTYKWCTGPGHGGTAMWVLHDPGTCKDYGKEKKSKSNKVTFKENGDNAGATGYNKAALTGMIKRNNKDLSDDEVTSKLEAIMAVMQS